MGRVVENLFDRGIINRKGFDISPGKPFRPGGVFAQAVAP